ncbi:MAG: CPBP family intramembrane metalloprotease [Phycisphaeraceae bacterium]|nr:CPBP family intramembrane metalloprotease [Phycisphaeraceae bacterium]
MSSSFTVNRVPTPLSSPAPLSPSERLYRWFELIALFFAIPVLLTFRSADIPIFPLLWIAAVGAVVLLLRDPAFLRHQIWNPGQVRPGIARVLTIWAVSAICLAAIILVFTPDDLFSFPRERTTLWLAVMLFYPVLSVVPQGIVYRVFFFHRYGGLFSTPAARIMAAGITFSFAHLVFQSPVAILLTFAGGLLFSYTYERHRSGLLASIEHALYGMTVFTLGLGRHLYLGTVQATS